METVKLDQVHEPNDGYPLYAHSVSEPDGGILGLQALEVPEDEAGFIGNSCTSSDSSCCNN